MFGLKPTTARVSSTGSFPLGPTVGVLGPIAASMDDLAITYLTIAGPENQVKQSIFSLLYEV